MSPDPAVLQEFVRRVVDSVHPFRIILFGSAARGEMGPNSDLDALVVVADESDCHAVNKSLRESFEVSVLPPTSWSCGKAIWTSTATILISSCTRPSRKGRSSTVPPLDPAPGTAREWLQRARGKLVLARQPLPPGGF